jgi:hypothetical protein
MKQLSWTSTDTIIDGVGAMHGMRIEQYVSTPRLTISENPQNAGLAIDEWGVVIARKSATNRYLKCKDTEATAVVASAINPGGITLGAYGYVTPGAFGHYILKEAIVRDIWDLDADKTILDNYLKAKYSV